MNNHQTPCPTHRAGLICVTCMSAQQDAEPKALTIGDTNRAGDLQITDTAWDSNGTMRVTVRCMIGGRSARTDADQVIAKARRLARRALPYPEKTRSSRLVRAWYSQGTEHYTFKVSRLPN